MKSTHIYTTSAAKQLDPSFREFLRLVSTYQKRQGHTLDAPYWYGERALVGLLSIAGWKKGWTTLEEFGHRKLIGKRHQNGRADLWFGKEKAKSSIYFEAKFALHKPSHKGISEHFIENGLVEAVKDARCSVGKEKGAKGYGLFFAPLKIDSKFKSNALDIIRNSTGAKPQISADIFGYHFSPEARSLSHDGFLFPGFVFWGRKVK